MNYYLLTLKHFENDLVVLMATDGENVYSIPEDEGNRFYVDYLAWVEEGNTPQPWPGSSAK